MDGWCNRRLQPGGKLQQLADFRSGAHDSYFKSSQHSQTEKHEEAKADRAAERARSYWHNQSIIFQTKIFLYFPVSASQMWRVFFSLSFCCKLNMFKILCRWSDKNKQKWYEEDDNRYFSNILQTKWLRDEKKLINWSWNLSEPPTTAWHITVSLLS